jgi:hypothetical protein
MRLKSVPRWMDGTCLECCSVKASDSDELYTFSFFEDVVQVQVVNDIVLGVQDTVHRLIYEVLKYLKRYPKTDKRFEFYRVIHTHTHTHAHAHARAREVYAAVRRLSNSLHQHI